MAFKTIILLWALSFCVGFGATTLVLYFIDLFRRD